MNWSGVRVPSKTLDNQTLMVYDCLICGYGVVATQEFSKLLSSVQIRVSALESLSPILSQGSQVVRQIGS